jgi:hypothetical protein
MQPEGDEFRQEMHFRVVQMQLPFFLADLVFCW